MGHNSSASIVFYRTTLACMLCLLAFVFAVEAKTAWYGPFSGYGSDVRAAKALPVNVPKVAQHGEPAPDPVPAAVLFAALALFTAAPPAGMDLHLLHGNICRESGLSNGCCFSSALLFRPPPVLS